MIVFAYKAFRKFINHTKGILYTPAAKIYFFLNGVKILSGLKVRGIIKVFVTRRGEMTIGNNLSINSGNNHNLIGRQQKTMFWVEGRLKLEIK